MTVSAVVATLAFLIGGVPCETRAQNAGSPAPDTLVTASLLCDAASIQPGKSFQLAVKLKIRDGWHVNWMNPGDAGLAPSVGWELPKGFKAEPIRWPFPQRFRTGPLVIFGYRNEVLLVARVTPPASLTPGGTVHLAAGVTWLACAGECIPGRGTASIERPVASAARVDAAASGEIEEALSRCPVPSGAWRISGSLTDGRTIAMDIQTASALQAPLDNVFFFPYEPGYIDNSADQRLSVLSGSDGRRAYQLRIDVSRLATARPARLSGVLVSSNGWTSAGKPGAIEVDVPLTTR